MPPDITNVPYQPTVNALTIENQNPDFLKPNHVGDNAASNNVDVQACLDIFPILDAEFIL